MAEGARLESVYTGNRIVGSNPTLSASQVELTAKFSIFCVVPISQNPYAFFRRSAAWSIEDPSACLVRDSCTPMSKLYAGFLVIASMLALSAGGLLGLVVITHLINILL